MTQGLYFCIYCLEDDSMQLRFDKKSRPFLICTSCSSRAFVRTGMMAISSYAAVAAIAREVRSDLIEAAMMRNQQQIDALQRKESAAMKHIPEILEKEVVKNEKK